MMIEVRPLTEHADLQDGRPLAAADLGLRGCRPASAAAVRGGHEDRRPGVRRFRRNADDRILPGDSRPESPAAKPICTATCWACCRNIATPASAAALKLAQRDDALARGIDLIEWTFDPLEIKNALFQHGAAGRHRAPLRAESVRHHQQPAARRPADRSLHRRMVDRKPARRSDSCRASRSNAIRWKRASPIPSDIATIRANDPARAREIQTEGQRAVPALHSIAAWR